ncbi:MAG: hypothetical protein WD200_00425 [Candidatus Andersenbacteria bacterium]
MAVKYSEWTRGQDEALLNKLGGMEVARRLLTCNEVKVTFDSDKRAFVTANTERRWREEAGVIRFSVTSDGTTGPQWIKRLGKRRFRLNRDSEELLHSPDFVPTNGVTYDVAVLKGTLFNDGNRITQNIHAEADHRGWKYGKDMPAEVACLIRETFSDEDIEAMGLWWIVVMHEPIKDSDGYPFLLGAHRYGDGPWLNACYGRPAYGWCRGRGFAVLVSQVSAKA